ncbi:MAG: hypothetical protein IT383_09660 [Deltaproteobacteria bacterium]|nr:hypothetical protein [Deltaproteobacteria bacterium]
MRGDVGAPGAYTKIVVLSTTRVHRAGASGAFTIGGIPTGRVTLRLEDDADGDGWPEYGGYAAATMPQSTDGSVGFVLLGDIPMAGAMTVRGTVLVDGAPAAAAGLVSRVYAMRGQCFPSGAGQFPGQADCDPSDPTELEHRVETSVEAEASVDANGAYQLTGVLSGGVELAFFLYAPAGDALGIVVDAVGPIATSGAAGQVIEVGTIDFPAVRPTLDARDVDLAITPPVPGGGVYLSRHGTLATCTNTAGGTPVSVALTEAAVHRVQVPVGAWNVTVCGSGIGGSAGTFLALPPLDFQERVPVWQVKVTESADRDPCINDQGDIDCDDDTLAAIPLLADATRTIWVGCAAQCVADASGIVAASQASCEVAGEVFDCDDDGDGQPDVTEPNACLGPLRGTDLDGDFLCSPSDAFPHCTANEPVACVAGTNDVTPGNPLDAPGVVDGAWTEVAPQPVALREPRSCVVAPGTASERVFVLGGRGDDGAIDADAEYLYDPVVDTWTALDDTAPDASHVAFDGREGHTLTFESFDPASGVGVAYVVSGADRWLVGQADVLSVRIDLAAGTSTFLPFPHSPRAHHTSTLLPLPSGTFLFSVGGLADFDTPTASGEVAFVAGATFNNALVTARYDHSAVNIGSTLWIIGGDTGDSTATASVETIVVTEVAMVFTVEPGPFSYVLPTPVTQAAAIFADAPDGPRILVTGGCNGGEGPAVADITLLDATSSASADAGALLEPRCGHSIVLLDDGRFLVAGGLNDGSGSPLASAEIIEVLTGDTVRVSRTGELAHARALHQAHGVGGGAIVVGGTDRQSGAGAIAVVERFTYEENMSGQVAP